MSLVWRFRKVCARSRRPGARGRNACIRQTSKRLITYVRRVDTAPARVQGAKGKPLVRAGRKATDLTVFRGSRATTTAHAIAVMAGTEGSGVVDPINRSLGGSMLSKLRRRAEDEKGFTLIELLVVILIIAILAAVAIPTFLNQRGKAYDSNAQSMVKSAQVAEETYATSNNGAYTASKSALIAIDPSLGDTTAEIGRAH